jgi:hypothetical protein
MVPRALMVPPGFPEFETRRRIVEAGTCLVEGRAWSGWAPITAVDVSVDGGETWSPATLGRADNRWAWAPWTLAWEAAPGRYELLCRARDETGREQPVEAPWNLGGYANNAVQRVVVNVG